MSPFKSIAKATLIFIVPALILSACGSSTSEPEPTPTLSALETKWIDACAPSTDRSNCDSLAQQVIESDGSDQFYVDISHPYEPACDKNPKSSDCNSERLLSNLVLEDLVCADDIAGQSMCISHLILENISGQTYDSGLYATLQNESGSSYKNDFDSSLKKGYLDMEFNSTLFETFNPKQRKLWYVGFTVSGQLSGWKRILIKSTSSDSVVGSVPLCLKDKSGGAYVYENCRISKTWKYDPVSSGYIKREASPKPAN